MDPFAEPGDVEAIWRPLSDEDRLLVLARIAQASQIVRDEVPGVDDRVDAGSLSAETVRAVVVGMVRRVLVNPDGLRSLTEQTGPFAVTRTSDSSLSSGEMFITARELARLSGRRSRQVAFTITPGPGPVFS